MHTSIMNAHKEYTISFLCIAETGRLKKNVIETCTFRLVILPVNNCKPNPAG
jgi:hypothetical protein